MSKRIDIVIDIETLGTDVDAKIIGIGAVAVVDGVIPEYETGDLKNPHIGEGLLHMAIRGDCSTNLRRTHTTSTLDFWAAQDHKLQEFYGNLTAPPNPVDTTFLFTLRESLLILSTFVAVCAVKGEVRPWGNGSVFDISILEHAYKQCGLKAPWQFWNIRDVRTRKEDALHIAELTGIGVDIPFEGIQHYALDDAYHEAKIIVQAQQLITDAAEALKALKEKDSE